VLPRKRSFFTPVFDQDSGPGGWPKVQGGEKRQAKGSCQVDMKEQGRRKKNPFVTGGRNVFKKGFHKDKGEAHQGRFGSERPNRPPQWGFGPTTSANRKKKGAGDEAVKGAEKKAGKT